MVIKWHTAGSTRLTLCVGRYAFKFARSERGRDGNKRERREWDRATPARRKMLCPIIYSFPFGIANVMPRAVQLTREDQVRRLEADDFPDWDYMPGGPSATAISKRRKCGL